MKTNHLFGTAFCVLSAITFLTSSLYSQNPKGNSPQTETSFCKNSNIAYDISAIENIYLHPQEVLSNVDSFWNNNKTMSMTKLWHTVNKIPVPFDSWKKWVAKIGKLSPEEAKKEVAFVNAQKIFSNVPKFNEQAIPHICSFLPKSTPALKTTVRLAANIHPYAFSI